jgi:hypothetical protein
MKNHNYTVGDVTFTIIQDIKKNPALLACKSFPELHDHCDANSLGCIEEMFKEIGVKRALPIFNDAQYEITLWLIANSIDCQPHFCSIDMNVESHSEGFKFKYGRYPMVDEEEAFFEEFWFDPIFLKIREMVRKRTGK